MDKKPSFSIFIDNYGHVRYKDHANGEGGNLYDLLCKYWGCSYNEVLDRLSKHLFPEGVAVKQKKQKKHSVITKEPTRLECKVRPWQQYDVAYWQSYGCNIDLLKYVEVYPISYKIVYKGNKKYTFPAPKFCYVFVEHKEGKTTKKIYSPYATKYKWVTDNDGSVIGLWSKVPEQGDKLCICSSLKDAVALWSNSGMPCIYPQGEAFNISDTAIGELKRRYKTVYICFDNDASGLEDAVKLAERTGFINIVIPPFQGGKDLSDYCKVNGTGKFKENIVPLFKS